MTRPRILLPRVANPLRMTDGDMPKRRCAVACTTARHGQQCGNTAGCWPDLCWRHRRIEDALNVVEPERAPLPFYGISTHNLEGHH